MQYYKTSFPPVLPCRGFWVGSVGFQRCPPGERITLGHRDEFRAFCVISGEGCLVCGGQETGILPGDLFLSFPGGTERILSGCLEYCWIGLCGEEAPILLEQTCAAGPDPVRTIYWPGEFQTLVSQIRNTGSNEAAGAFQRQSLAYSLLARMAQPDNVSPDFRFSHTEKALQFLREHYRQPITVADIAGHVGISRSWLYQCFMAYLEQPPAQYLRDLRISRAKALLIHTVMSVQEVAYAVGFLDPLYFSKVFSSCVGLSPRDFRNMRDNMPPGTRTDHPV